MKVNVTLDYYDGRLSKTTTCYAEDLPSGAGLAIYLKRQGVASITITAIEPLDKMIKHINQADTIKTEED